MYPICMYSYHIHVNVVIIISIIISVIASIDHRVVCMQLWMVFEIVQNQRISANKVFTFCCFWTTLLKAPTYVQSENDHCVIPCWLIKDLWYNSLGERFWCGQEQRTNDSIVFTMAATNERQNSLSRHTKN